MYLKYCLFANIAICILGIIIFLIMKKRNQTSRKNTFILTFCTVMAMVCASLIPLIADYLVERFTFSITESLIVSFFFLAAPALIIFYLLIPVFTKQFIDSGNKTIDEAGITVEDIVGYSEDKTVKDQAPGQDPDTFKAAETVTENFETGEKNKDIVKMAETDISLEDESEIRNVFQEIGKQHEEKLHTEEIHSISEERNVYIEEDFSEEENATGNKEINTEVPAFISDNQSVIIRLLDIAMDSKINHNYQIAITAYERALTLDPDDELRYLLILDLCSLYKITGNLESIYKLLDSPQSNMLSEDKKEDILRNIKNY